MENGYSVAIKFDINKNTSDAENEFEILQHLRAHKNRNVERFGIPAVYYYGRWMCCSLTAISKFDKSIEEIHNETIIHPLDAMILLRNFVS